MGPVIRLLVTILPVVPGLGTPAMASVAQDDARAAGQSSNSASQQKAARHPLISIRATIEDEKKVVLATVTGEGKPLEGIQVAFFVRRTFGLLPLGVEETLDDGTSAVPFPTGLPAGPSGKLQVVAEIKKPEEFAAVRTEVALEPDEAAEVLDRGRLLARTGLAEPAFVDRLLGNHANDPFPRALWAPRAPLPLLITIGTLVGGVWCAYAYVFVQLAKMRKVSASRVPATGRDATDQKGAEP